MTNRYLLTVLGLLLAANVFSQALPTDGPLTLRPVLQQLGERLLKHKTGTIENPGEDHSAFIAFAPINDPKIAICVYVEHGGFGADLAAPMAGLIIESYLKGKLSPKSETTATRLSKKTCK